MRVLVTDESGVWKYTHSEAAPKQLPFKLECPCTPCAAHALIACCCKKTLECICLQRHSWNPVSCMPAVPGISSMAFSPCGRYLYQLGTEADSIHTRLIATGELLFAAPVGVFPRSMRMIQQGRHLLIAGGAAGEAYILNAPELLNERTIYTKHACFAADLWAGGIVLVCAAEGDDIHTVIYTLSARGVKPAKLTELPGQPGGLCVCPDGKTALLSTPDGLMKLDLCSGIVLWNRPEWALCMQLECRGSRVLISDTLDGRVCLMNHNAPWEQQILFRGTTAQACFL